MKRKDSFLLRNVGGEPLLVPIGEQVVDTNAFVVLNETGRFLWELLTEERSLDDLATAMTREFDVGPEQAHADVQAFLAEIARMGLLDGE